MKMRIARALTLCLLLAAASFSSFAQGKSSQDQVLEIPFDFYRNEIILQVKVNGKGPFNMMLDTGTDPSVVDLTTARGLGLKLQSSGATASGGGREANSIYETKLPVVEVGPLTVKNLETVALDLSKMSARLGKPLHGVLGHSFLNGRIVQIDYPKQTVRIYSRSPFAKPTQANTPGRTVLSFRYDDNVLVDGVFVNGKKLTANLDTGSDDSFKLTPAAVTYLGLEGEFNGARTTTSVGFNGVSENREGKVDNVTVGGISVAAPAVVFFGKGTGRDKKPWGINIGNAFLKDFVLTIDYRSKLLILEKG
jgi:predicted aspartyl protease